MQKDENFYKKESEKMVESSSFIYPNGFKIDCYHSSGEGVAYRSLILTFDMSEATFKLKYQTGGGGQFFHSMDQGKTYVSNILDFGSGYFHVNFEKQLVLYFSQINRMELSPSTKKISQKKDVIYVDLGFNGYDSLLKVDYIRLDYDQTNYTLNMKENLFNDQKVRKVLTISLKFSNMKFEFQEF